MAAPAAKFIRILSVLALLILVLGAGLVAGAAVVAGRLGGPGPALEGSAAAEGGSAAGSAVAPSGTGAAPAQAIFRVGPGESAQGIARRLESEGFIRSALYFRLVLKAKGLETAMKVGTYELKPSMDAVAVAELLASGRQRLVRLTVPEGSGLRSLAEAAERAGVASAEEVLALAVDREFIASLGIHGPTLLGYLYPDTYFMPEGAGAKALLSHMVDTFRGKLAAIAPESAALSPAELHRYVVLASVVEREYRLAEEAPLMAGVFWNRLRIGMALQSCATVVYVITERLGKPHPTRLFDRDLQIDDPFNSYRFPGLPPAAIANPGAVALAAVFKPEPSRYLYFRLIDEASGKHYFSESLDQHIRAAGLIVKPRN